MFQKQQRISTMHKSSKYHRKGIDEIAINGIERASVVIRRSTDRRKINRLHHQKNKNPNHKIIKPRKKKLITKTQENAH